MDCVAKNTQIVKIHANAHYFVTIDDEWFQ